MQRAKRGVGTLALIGETAAEPVSDIIQPFVEGAGEMRLAARGLVGEAPQVTGEIGKTHFEFTGAAAGFESLFAADALSPPTEDRHQNEKKQRHAR